MKNTLNDLNNHLFAALERLNDDALPAAEIEAECNRASAVVGIAEAIVRNADTQLRAIKLMDDCGLVVNRTDMPAGLLGVKNEG